MAFVDPKEFTFSNEPIYNPKIIDFFFIKKERRHFLHKIYRYVYLYFFKVIIIVVKHDLKISNKFLMHVMKKISPFFVDECFTPMAV